MRSAAAAEPRTTLPRAGFAASEPCAVAVAVPGARSVASSSRPFRVLGLQQVAVGAESKDDMRKIWQVWPRQLTGRAVLASAAAYGCCLPPRARCPLRGRCMVSRPCSNPHLTRSVCQDMLGLRKHGEFRSEKENVDEDILVMGRGLAEVEVDIMAPIDVTKSPKVCSRQRAAALRPQRACWDAPCACYE